MFRAMKATFFAAAASTVWVGGGAADVTVTFPKPTPEDVERWACEVATSEMIEEKATEAVCQLIANHFSAIPECTEMLEMLWDKVKARCPKGKMLVELPTPQEIEKWICEAISEDLIEKEATEEVCELLDEHFGTIPDCEKLVDMLWDKVKAECPKVALRVPTPDEIEQWICEAISEEMIEKEATEEVCKLLDLHFGPIPDCDKLLGMLWDKIKAECPKPRLTLPTPDDIEKWVCDAASSEMIETEATEEVCKLIAEHFTTIPDCVQMVEMLWDKIKAECPKPPATLLKLVALPTPDEVEKWVCEAASSAMIEKEATEEVCKLIAEHFTTIPDCVQMVELLWNKIKAECPKPKVILKLVAVPTPDEIEKWVCEAASSEMIEKEATEEVCKLIAEHFTTIPDCVQMVEMLWNKIKAECPKPKMVLKFVAVPTPDEIEKWLCEAASSAMIKKEATEEACRLLEEHFGTIPDCEKLVGMLWDKIKAECPKLQLALPTPDEIEKWICEAISEDLIERDATEEVCKLLDEHFGAIPDCEKLVDMLWDKVKAECPKVALRVPTPDEIEKWICEAISEDVIEKEATEEVCKLLDLHFGPIPDCDKLLGMLWDKIKAECPKQLTLPTPDEIEKWICEAISEDLIEKEATEEVCELLDEHFGTIPDCEKLVDLLWDKVKAECPKDGRFATLVV